MGRRRKKKSSVASLDPNELLSDLGGGYVPAGMPAMEYDVEEYEDDLHDIQMRNHASLVGSTMVMGLLVAMDFSICFPGMYPLISGMGGDFGYYALTFSCYSLGHLISALVLTKYMYLRSAYAAADGSTSRPMALLPLGRFICGLGAGIDVTGYAHMCRHSVTGLRSRRIRFFRWLQLFGSVAAPGIGALLAQGSFAFFESVKETNFAAVVMAMLAVVYIALLLGKDRICKRKEDWGIWELYSRSIEQEAVQTHTYNQRKRSELGTSAAMVAKPIDVFSILFLDAVCTTVFWMFAVVFPAIPFSSDWSSMSNYVLFLVLAGMFVCGLVFMHRRRVYIDDYTAPLMGILIMTGGCVFLSSSDDDLPYWQLWVATGFLGSGFVVVSLRLATVYAEIMKIEAPFRHQRMSLCLAAVSLSRLVGPLVGTYAQVEYGQNLVAHICALLLMACMLLGFNVLSYTRISGPEEDAGGFDAEMTRSLN